MRGCITKKGSNYSIVVDIGRVDGKRKQKWFNGYRTKREAQNALTKILSQLQDNTFVDTDKITVKEYLLQWLENYVDTNLSPTTAYGYRVNVEKHIIPNLGNIQLQKLQPLHIQQLYNEKLKNGRVDGKGGLSAKSVIYIHRVFRKALAQAVKLQIISRNVADLVEVPKKKPFNAKILDSDEVPSLLEAFKNTNLYIPVLLGVAVGLRRGEALGLRWQDIDYKNKTITISQTILHSKAGIIINTPKTIKSHRTIVISDTIIAALKYQQERQQENKDLLGEAYQDNDLVTCGADGSPINPSTFSRNFSDTLERNDLTHIRFHDLRHTNATLMLKSDIPAKIASERLGHSTIGITLDLYSHVLKEMQQDAASRLESLLFVNKSEI
ncbi:tyrosine-type recombinase/integrase [Petroclostridium sp. X23]|uniref:tyrosine-type recombinase/integrase n=1 Tax=Petroclostridium sp. X23 TaxID=3045146 RepID=UPI0024AE5D7D|nr:tyrosine-type recombinase/integrase [Petroclostridium sp. X23]WHH57285.1 tyrosine-type recombinase/integrase [Petroclostridium sp. X23]